jgi:hypothetical protein
MQHLADVEQCERHREQADDEQQLASA